MKALYVYSFLNAKSEDQKVKSLKKDFTRSPINKA